MIPTLFEAEVEATGILNGIFAKGWADNLIGYIKDALPIVIPVVIGLLGFRKAWSFIKGNIQHS